LFRIAAETTKESRRRACESGSGFEYANLVAGGEAAAALATVVEVETAPRKRKRPSVLDRRPSESVGVHLLGVDLRALNGTTAMEATLLYGIEEVS
jgi:hypothetical protein